MGSLPIVGSLKLQVSFAKEPYKKDDILQKRPMILRSLWIVATPYQTRFDFEKRHCKLGCIHVVFVCVCACVCVCVGKLCVGMCVREIVCVKENDGNAAVAAFLTVCTRTHKRDHEHICITLGLEWRNEFITHIHTHTHTHIHAHVHTQTHHLQGTLA